ncbi:MAG: hypothetical protein HKP00_04340 [Flavobacteriaceae bacterium]|nr:hypothetical protein [Flavobacteriaceae bacterium]
MKKVLKNVTFLVLTLITVNVYSAKLELKKFNSEIDPEIELKTTKVVVKNKKGRIIQQAMINLSETLLEDLELSSLPNGFYSFEIDKYSEIKITPFVVISNQVVIDQKNSQIIFKPVLRVNGMFVYLTQLNLEKKHMQVEIYDIDKNRIYTEVLKDDIKLERIYDFSKYKGMKVQIKLKSQNRTFVHNLEF